MNASTAWFIVSATCWHGLLDFASNPDAIVSSSASPVPAHANASVSPDEATDKVLYAVFRAATASAQPVAGGEIYLIVESEAWLLQPKAPMVAPQNASSAFSCAACCSQFRPLPTASELTMGFVPREEHSNLPREPVVTVEVADDVTDVVAVLVADDEPVALAVVDPVDDADAVSVKLMLDVAVETWVAEAVLDTVLVRDLEADVDAVDDTLDVSVVVADVCSQLMKEPSYAPSRAALSASAVRLHSAKSLLGKKRYPPTGVTTMFPELPGGPVISFSKFRSKPTASLVRMDFFTVS